MGSGLQQSRQDTSVGLTTQTLGAALVQPGPWGLGMFLTKHSPVLWLLCLHQAEELYCIKGFLGDLQNSRIWGMTPLPGERHLVSPHSWLSSWGNPASRNMRHALVHTPGCVIPAAQPIFEICTLATLWVGHSCNRTVGAGLFELCSSSVSGSPRSSSGLGTGWWRPYSDGWTPGREKHSRTLATVVLPVVSRIVSMADVRGDAPGLDSAHWTCKTDLQPWLNSPRFVKGPSEFPPDSACASKCSPSHSVLLTSRTSHLREEVPTDGLRRPGWPSTMPLGCAPLA